MTEPTSYKDWKPVDIGYGINASREAHDMYMTVKRLELEDWIKNYQGGYCEERDRISKNLENNNHSGASFSGTMYVVKQVFIDGWYPKYKSVPE
tara:strand:- start:184 stop:465 length:282 start_codon:yes stop_codon:yes gene_type:complete